VLYIKKLIVIDRKQFYDDLIRDTLLLYLHNLTQTLQILTFYITVTLLIRYDIRALTHLRHL